MYGQISWGRLSFAPNTCLSRERAEAVDQEREQAIEMPIDATSMIFVPSHLHREDRASARRMAEVNEGRFQHSLDKPPQCRIESRHT